MSSSRTEGCYVFQRVVDVVILSPKTSPRTKLAPGHVKSTPGNPGLDLRSQRLSLQHQRPIGQRAGRSPLIVLPVSLSRSAPGLFQRLNTLD